jgi:hypothetical protein
MRRGQVNAQKKNARALVTTGKVFRLPSSPVALGASEILTVFRFPSLGEVDRNRLSS